MCPHRKRPPEAQARQRSADCVVGATWCAPDDPLPPADLACDPGVQAATVGSASAASTASVLPARLQRTGAPDSGILTGHGLGQLHGFIDQPLHDLRFWHGRDHLALDEDLALAVA